MIISVLQHHHIHPQATQVPPKSLQHVVTHNPQLLGGARRGVFLRLLATQGAFFCFRAGGTDPLSSLTFLNGQRQ